MSRINWGRCRPYRQIESKLAPGTVLRNGTRVPSPPQDELGRRAAKEMRDGLRTLSARDRRGFAS
jgi:hypothetical protein